MPAIIIGPMVPPKPPIRAKAIGTRISASSAESRSVMISTMKTSTMP